MTNELTLDMLDEAITKIGVCYPTTLPKRVRISVGDYNRLLEACVKVGLPGPSENFTLGFFGEQIMPDETVEDNHYQFDF